jgi:peptidoglycan hydrolase-like protein with peptidoglycan-binding domain
MKRNGIALAALLAAGMTSLGTLAYAQTQNSNPPAAPPNAAVTTPAPAKPMAPAADRSAAAKPATQPTAPEAAAAKPEAKPAKLHKVSMLSQRRIEEIQVALDDHNDGNLAIDGIWGPHTAKALRAFQKQHDLPATGRATHATLAKLDPPTWND